MEKIPALSDEQKARIRDIALSFERYAGRALVSPGGDLVGSLWISPSAIVAHDTASDPIFFFGNQAALALFEMDFASFTKLPSRYSAEPMLRDERARLLERVERSGHIDDYSGVRISSTGKRFRIARAHVWNVVNEKGSRVGQAAAFSSWALL